MLLLKISQAGAPRGGAACIQGPEPEHKYQKLGACGVEGHENEHFADNGILCIRFGCHYRSLPHFAKLDYEIESKFFVKRNYLTGLDTSGFFQAFGSR